MELKELLDKVKNDIIPKGELESLHTAFTNLYSLVMLEKSELEQKEAIYFLNHQEKTDIAATRKWKGSPDGLKLLQLDNEAKVITKNLQSIRSRLYSSVY
jgi:hypothetical protein